MKDPSVFLTHRGICHLMTQRAREEQSRKREGGGRGESECASKSLHHLTSHCILWVFSFLYIESVDLNTWTRCAGAEWGGWITYSSSLLSHKGKNRMVWRTPLFLWVTHENWISKVCFDAWFSDFIMLWESSTAHRCHTVMHNFPESFYLLLIILTVWLVEVTRCRNHLQIIDDEGFKVLIWRRVS